MLAWLPHSNGASNQTPRLLLGWTHLIFHGRKIRVNPPSLLLVVALCLSSTSIFDVPYCRWLCRCHCCYALPPFSLFFCPDIPVSSSPSPRRDTHNFKIVYRNRVFILFYPLIPPSPPLPHVLSTTRGVSTVIPCPGRLLPLLSTALSCAFLFMEKISGGRWNRYERKRDDWIGARECFWRSFKRSITGGSIECGGEEGNFKSISLQ